MGNNVRTAILCFALGLLAAGCQCGSRNGTDSAATTDGAGGADAAGADAAGADAAGVDAATADSATGTDMGVWRSQDEGATWLPYETGLPNVRVMDLEINTMARKLVAGTYGRGAWEIDLPDLTAAPEPWNPASLHLMLDRPYPNPASERTTFRFAAKDVSEASLDIYDVRGRLLDHVTAVRGDGREGRGDLRAVPCRDDRVRQGQRRGTG